MPHRPQFSLVRIDKAGGDFDCYLKNENPCDASTHWTTEYEKGTQFNQSSSLLPAFAEADISTPYSVDLLLETGLISHRLFSDTAPHVEFV
jgi:hypothetical protein